MKRISKERNEGHPLHNPRKETERNTGNFDLRKVKKTDFILKIKLFQLVQKTPYNNYRIKIYQKPQFSLLVTLHQHSKPKY